MPATTKRPPHPEGLPDISTIKNFPVDNPRAKPAWKWGGEKQGWYLEVLDRTYYWDPEYVKPNGTKGRGREIRVHIGRIVDGVYYTDAQYRARFKRGGAARSFTKPKTRSYNKTKEQRVPPISLPPKQSAMEQTVVPAEVAQKAATPAPVEKPRLAVNQWNLGGTLLCYRAAERNGLVADLEASYGKLNAASILSIAIHWLVTSRNAAWLYEEWAEDFILPAPEPMDSKEMTEFYELIGKDQDALSRLFLSRFKRIPETDCISYDSTNIETEALDCSNAVIGKSKDGVYRSQINLAVCYAQKAQCPLMFRIFPGNVADTTTVADLIDRLTVFSDRQARTVVLDRGYFSKDNLSMWAAQQYFDAIVAAKIGTTWVWDEIEKHMADYWDWKHYLKDSQCYARTDCMTLTDSQNKAFKVWLHTYRSDFKTGVETDEFARELAKFSEKWELGKVAASHSSMKYFKVIKDASGKEKLVENDEEVQARLRRCGFFACATTKDMTAGEVLKHYGERDGIEKIFKSGKTELEMDAVRAHKDNMILGRHVVGFVALSIMAELKKAMILPYVAKQKNGKTKEYRPLIEEYSVYKLLQGLSTVHLIRYGDSVAVSEVTSKQHLLLERAGFADAYSDPLPEYCYRN